MTKNHGEESTRLRLRGVTIALGVAVANADASTALSVTLLLGGGGRQRDASTALSVTQSLGWWRERRWHSLSPRRPFASILLTPAGSRRRRQIRVHSCGFVVTKKQWFPFHQCAETVVFDVFVKTQKNRRRFFDSAVLRSK